MGAPAPPRRAPPRRRPAGPDHPPEPTPMRDLALRQRSQRSHVPHPHPLSARLDHPAALPGRQQPGHRELRAPHELGEGLPPQPQRRGALLPQQRLCRAPSRKGRRSVPPRPGIIGRGMARPAPGEPGSPAGAVQGGCWPAERRSGSGAGVLGGGVGVHRYVEDRVGLGAVPAAHLRFQIHHASGFPTCVDRQPRPLAGE